MGVVAAAVFVVVVVNSLSGHNIALDMKLITKRLLYEFTLGWDPD